MDFFIRNFIILEIHTSIRDIITGYKQTFWKKQAFKILTEKSLKTMFPDKILIETIQCIAWSEGST